MEEGILNVLPAIIVEHVERDGGMAVSLTPGRPVECGVEYVGSTLIPMEELQKLAVNSLASGLITAILQHEESTGELGKTMSAVINQLEQQYLSPSSEVITNEIQDDRGAAEAPEEGSAEA